MNKLLNNLLAKFRPAPDKVVVVGTDYPSYQLGCKIQAEPSLQLAFFMNEEPWHHRTFMLGAELRYSSELISLVQKYAITAVLCAQQHDFDGYQQRFADSLAQHHCQLLLCDNGEVLLGK